MEEGLIGGSESSCRLGEGDGCLGSRNVNFRRTGGLGVASLAIDSDISG